MNADRRSSVTTGRAQPRPPWTPTPAPAPTPAADLPPVAEEGTEGLASEERAPEGEACDVRASVLPPVRSMPGPYAARSVTNRYG